MLLLNNCLDSLRYIGSPGSASILFAILCLLGKPNSASADCVFGFPTVSAGTSSALHVYRSPYSFFLPMGDWAPLVPENIVGMGIAGSNDHVYTWYDDGTVGSGFSWDLGARRQRYNYKLPAGKNPGDIVGMAIAGSNDHVYAWYRDGTVSSGTSSNLVAYRQPYAYVLPAGKTPDDIVGMGIAGSTDHVYVWFKDGTVSSGTSGNLGAYRAPYTFTMASAGRPTDIVGMGIAGSNDHVFAWYRSPGASSGDLAAVDWCYKINAVAGAGGIETITFYARMQNVSDTGWCSPRTGTYTIGASFGSIYKEVRPTLPASPAWGIGPREVKTLDFGLTLPFSVNNLYTFPGSWVFVHPDDSNFDNNRFSSGIQVYGAQFLDGGDMTHKRCPAP